MRKVLFGAEPSCLTEASILISLYRHNKGVRILFRTCPGSVGFRCTAKEKEAQVGLYVLVGEALNRLANNTFGNGRVASVQQILDYVDAAAFQLWEVNH